MTSPDIAPAWGRMVSRSAVALLLAACDAVPTTSTPSPETFHFPAGTVFLSEAVLDHQEVCGTLATMTDGTRIKVTGFTDTRATVHHTFGGYKASELGVCPNDTDGFIWHDEGEQYVQLPANH